MSQPNPTTKNYSLRRATPADAETIADYNARLAEETENTILDRAVLLPGVRAALADENKARYFVAVAETNLTIETETSGTKPIIGQAMVTYEWSDWRNGVVWWFQSVYVAESYRGQGVFRALYDHILEEGKRAGAVGFRLYAVDDNAPALATYERLGMERTHYIVLEQMFPKG